jgi:hypothetical protein
MREDMFEVIIERPRHKSRARYPRELRRSAGHAARHDPDSLGFGIGMAPRRVGTDDRKSLNENLAPLRRYLERQVNRPWDKVWSEICAKLRPDSTVQQHVRDHVGDFVAVKTFIKDGAVWTADAFLTSPQPLKESRLRLYVDPRSGLLRRNKYFKTYKQKKAARTRELKERMREIAPNVQVHRFGERGWWEVVLVPTELDCFSIKRRRLDVVIESGFSDLPPPILYGREGVYAVAKRQLSKREIARLTR